MAVIGCCAAIAVLAAFAAVRSSLSPWAASPRHDAEELSTTTVESTPSAVPPRRNVRDALARRLAEANQVASGQPLASPPSRIEGPLFTLPTATPHVIRPSNGELLAWRMGQGLGELVIENGTSRDAVAKLVDTEAAYVAFYIRAHETVTIERIPAGEYWLKFNSGRDWDAEKRQFLIDPAYRQFDGPLLFTESGRRYTSYTITLHPVVGGNAPTDPKSPVGLRRYLMTRYMCAIAGAVAGDGSLEVVR